MWGIARTRTLKREGGQGWWKIEGAFLKYLRCLFYFCSILEANLCVGGSHSSQHEDDNLTWGFLDRKLGEAIQCEGGLEQQDMPCRGGLSDEYPMNIRRFFRQTGVFWWVFFFGGVTNETHIKSGKWWQCLWSFPSVSVLLFFLAFLQGMDVIMINKTSAKSGDEFSRQMNDREAENVASNARYTGGFWPHAHRREPLTLWNCYAVDCCVGAWFHARSKFEQLKRLQVLKIKMVSRSFSCFEVWMPRLFKIRYPPPKKRARTTLLQEIF